MSKLIISSLAAILALSGCYRTKKLPPPAKPAKTVPDVSLAGEPGDGLSRVVIDSEQPALVEKVSGGSVNAAGAGRVFAGSLSMRTRLCTTPCVVDMAPGPYELKFTGVNDESATSRGFINVDDRPSVYRHSLGRQESNAWKGWVGWPLAIIGGSGTLGALASIGENNTDAIVGGAVSAGITALGIWLIHGSTVIEQPGNGVQFHPGGATAGR